MSSIHRQPSGSTIGGQFASVVRPAPDASVSLESSMRSELATATSWEDGINRHAFDDLLSHLPEHVRDDAWKSVSYLSEQQAKAYEGEDIDVDADAISRRAHEVAVDGADGIRDEFAWDEAVASAYAENLQDGYDSEMAGLCDALASSDARGLSYIPVKPELPTLQPAPAAQAA